MRYSILTAMIALLTLSIPASAQPARTHFQNGERLLNDGQWVFAAREFEQAVHLDSENQRYQFQFAQVRVEASQRAESAARLLISAGRSKDAQSFIDDALRFDPNNSGAASLMEQVNPRLAKLHDIQKVYVDEIDGNGGVMMREKLMALLANTTRFEVVEDRALADATINGRAESRESGTAVTASDRGIGQNSNVKAEKQSVVSETTVLRLTASGEILWAWDDTKDCAGPLGPKIPRSLNLTSLITRETATRPPGRSPGKAKCAIDDLVGVAN